MAGLQASFGTRNGFGGWLAVMIPLFLGMVVSNQFLLKVKIGFAGLLILLITSLGLTSSRSAWLGLTLGLLFILCYFFILLNKGFKIASLVLMPLLLIGLFFVLPQTIKTRLDSISRIENSSLLRINLWKESISMIEDFPLFGVGLNAYSKVAPLYSKGEGGYYPHNSYLHMAAEIGLVGLICFLWVMVKLFKLGIHTFKKTKDMLLLGLLGSIVAFLGQSFFDVNLYALQLATLFWFVLGLAVARIKILSAT